MKMSLTKASALFLGVSAITFLVLESLGEAQETAGALASARVVGAVEVPAYLRKDVKQAFDGAEILIGRERTAVDARNQALVTPQLRAQLEAWSLGGPGRPAAREQLEAALEEGCHLQKLDFAVLVTQENEVIWPRSSTSGLTQARRVAADAALLLFSEEQFRSTKPASGYEALPLDFGSPGSQPEGNQAQVSEQQIYIVAAVPVWTRPDVPAAVLTSGVSFRSLAPPIQESFTSQQKLRWHAFVDEKAAGARVVAGELLGKRVRKAFFQSLVKDGTTDEPAFEGEEFAPGRWRPLYGFGDRLLGGWGVTASPVGLERVARAPEVVRPAPWAPIVAHLNKNWTYYAYGAGGLVALVVLLVLVNGTRSKAPSHPYRLRSAPPLEYAAPIVPPPPRPAPPASAPADNSLVSQFELNWKTFASYTQDLLQQKLRELEDAPLRGVKDVREQVSRLHQALAEMKSELAAARSEVRDTTFGVVQQVATLVGQEGKAKKEGEEEQAVLRKLEGDFEKAAQRFTHLDDTVGKLAEYIAEKKSNDIDERVRKEVDRLEAEWAEKVKQFAREIEDAKKEGQRLFDELEKSRGVEISLRGEVAASGARAAEVESRLAAREQEVSALEKDREVAWRREREAREELGARSARQTELEVLLATAQEAIAEARSSHESLGTQLTAARDDAARSGRRLAEVEQEAQAARAELSARELALSQEKDRARKDQLEGEEIKKRLASQEAEMVLLRGALDARESECAALQAQVAKLKEDGARLEREVQEGIHLRAEVESLTRDLKKEKHTSANSQQALELHKIELGELAARLTQAEAARDQVTKRADSLGVEARGLRASMEQREQQSRKDKESLEKALESSLGEVKRLRAAEEQVGSLKAQVAQLEAGATANAAFKVEAERLQSFERERKELLESLERVGKELERVRAEAEGIRSFQGVLVDGCIPAAIVAFDVQLKVFAWNTKAEGLWNKSPSAAIGRVLSELSLKGVEKEAMQLLRRTLESKRSMTLPQASFTDHRGKVRHVRLSCDPILDPRGEVLGGVLVAEDISEKVEHEIEARLQALFSQSLAKSLPGALVVVDTQNRVMSWNRNAELILGVPEKQALGESFFDLGTPLSKDSFRKHFEEAARDRQPHRVRVRFELSGIPTQFVVTQAPFLGGDDAVRGTILLVQEAAEGAEARR